MVTKESKSTSLGIEQFLEAKDIFEFREALADIDNMFFNFVVGDTKGNIAHQATGLVPKEKEMQGKLHKFTISLIVGMDLFQKISYHIR